MSNEYLVYTLFLNFVITSIVVTRYMWFYKREAYHIVDGTSSILAADYNRD